MCSKTPESAQACALRNKGNYKCSTGKNTPFLLIFKDRHHFVTTDGTPY